MRWRPSYIRFFVGLRKSKIGPGRYVAGVVETIGKSVTTFKAGDAVFGTCKGSFAEFACAQESRLAIKPENVSFEQAPSAPVAPFVAVQTAKAFGAEGTAY